MTEPVYLDADRDRRFRATVERVVDDRVVLDRTLFYPTGGGQPHDTGTLTAEGTTWRVVDVRKKDTIYHAVDGDDPPAPGTAVDGAIEWDRRYGHMRHHTAQHLLSAVLLEEYDARTTGNQVYAERARIDCDYDRFDADDLHHIEARVNEHIDAALPVRWHTMDRDEAQATLDPERTRLDLLPASVTAVRIVEIGDYDRTACAGTHVRSTDECGRFVVDGRETKGSRGERIAFHLGEG